MPGRDATTLRRGIEILFQLGSDEATRAGGMGVVRVARNIGQDKSQVSRALKVLAQAGLADRAPGKAGYWLGRRLYALAASAGDRHLLQAVPPLLARLAREFGVSAYLCVLRERHVLTLWTESPYETITEATRWVGRTVPAWCTSAGCALLMDHGPEALRALFADGDFRAGGPNAPRDVAELLARISEAATRGYAVSDEEFEHGLMGVAVPARDDSGRIVAALNMSGRKHRFAGRCAKVGSRMQAAALKASKRPEVVGRWPVTPGANQVEDRRNGKVK